MAAVFKCPKCKASLINYPERCPVCNIKIKYPKEQPQQMIKTNPLEEFEYFESRNIADVEIDTIVRRKHNLFGQILYKKEISDTWEENVPLTITRDRMWGDIDSNGNINIYGGDIHVDGGYSYTRTSYDLYFKRNIHDPNYGYWKIAENTVPDVSKLRDSIGVLLPKHVVIFFLLILLGLFINLIGLSIMVTPTQQLLDSIGRNGCSVAGTIAFTIGYIIAALMTVKFLKNKSYNQIYYKNRSSLLSMLNNSFELKGKEFINNLDKYALEAARCDLEDSIGDSILINSNTGYGKAINIKNNHNEAQLIKYRNYLHFFGGTETWKLKLKTRGIVALIAIVYLVAGTISSLTTAKETPQQIVVIGVIGWVACIILLFGVPALVALIKYSKQKSYLKKAMQNK
ncbi:MAG: hypothetical protein E7181_04445 [Erysipelotrichaceae bacterium]|nr:hypothetical protein [Erysipelotrichaceae bacterium]